MLIDRIPIQCTDKVLKYKLSHSTVPRITHMNKVKVLSVKLVPRIMAPALSLSDDEDRRQIFQRQAVSSTQLTTATMIGRMTCRKSTSS